MNLRNLMINNVKDLSIDNDTNVTQIFNELLCSGGFQSKNLAEGFNILSSMINDKKCLRFCSFVGSIISTGLRGIIRDMIKKKWFDVVITTCGALDHDIARYYTKYKSGNFASNDKKLANDNIHRLGNILIPSNNYGQIIENKMQLFLKNNNYSNGDNIAVSDVTKLIGKNMGEESFLYWAYKNDIPVIVPGIMDGAVGTQIWLFIQRNQNLRLNITSDSDLLSSMVFKAKKSGAFMVGGGISKHHTLWWNQYKGGLDYAVYITTSEEFDGSSSGATISEAISWGKVKQDAKQTTIHAEATTVLPFLYRGLLDKVKSN